MYFEAPLNTYVVFVFACACLHTHAYGGPILGIYLSHSLPYIKEGCTDDLGACHFG